MNWIHLAGQRNSFTIQIVNAEYNSEVPMLDPNDGKLYFGTSKVLSICENRRVLLIYRL